MVTYNPDAEVLTLATVEFNFLMGGDFKATTNVGAIHLRPFNYRLSTWDAAYGFQVPGPSCFRVLGFCNNTAGLLALRIVLP